MRRFTAAMAGSLAIAGLGIPTISAAEDTCVHRPVRILLQDYAKPDCKDCTPTTPASCVSSLGTTAAAARAISSSPATISFSMRVGEPVNQYSRAARCLASSLLLPVSGGEAGVASVADAWLQDLRTVEDVKAQGNLKCRGAACRMRVTTLDDQRISTVQKAGPSLVIMSMPVDVWR